MEEVDNIIIHTLRQIGCDISEEILSLKEFTTEIIVEATARCLRRINDEVQLPTVLPASMSARFRLGTSLAQACQDLGYQGGIGYQTFLYSSETDIRRVFMFLVEKLPRDSGETDDESIGNTVMLKRRIATELGRHLSGAWTPSYCKRRGICWSGTPRAWHHEGARAKHSFRSHPLITPHGLGDLTTKVPKETKRYYSEILSPVTAQPPYHHDVPASVLERNAVAVTEAAEWEAEWNNSGIATRMTQEEYKAKKREKLQKKLMAQIKSEIERAELNAAATADLSQIISELADKGGSAAQSGKGSRFTRAEKLQFAQDELKAAAMAGLSDEGLPKVDTEEELQKKREEEVTALQRRLSEINEQVDGLELEIKKMNANVQQSTEQIAQKQTRNVEEEESYKVKKRTIDLLPEAENNIAKLQDVIEGSSQRLVSLATQWEKRRQPLIQQFRELKVLNENKVSETQQKLEEIKELRKKMKEVAEEARGKDDFYKQLVNEYERMTKDVNRSAYTRRILEIVGNIKKQKQGIDKILLDTKDVQKEINVLSGKLDRTFAVTDELIFRDAKKDEACRKAYKYLASLHENCNTLIKTVEETGVIMREIRDLEDQIDMESQKETLANLEKITADYKEMKEENSTLTKKLKAMKANK